jgi:hypothetical protein
MGEDAVEAAIWSNYKRWFWPVQGLIILLAWSILRATGPFWQPALVVFTSCQLAPLLAAIRTARPVLTPGKGAPPRRTPAVTVVAPQRACRYGAPRYRRRPPANRVGDHRRHVIR